MARITASVYTSHVPAIGAALDLGKTQEAYWQPVFKGYEFSKQWMKDNKPDVVFLVYNDHATAFSLEMIPTFAIGTAAQFQPADEGWGPRRCPPSSAIRSLLRTSPSRSSSRISTSPSSTRWMWTTASPCRCR
jgi:hypothetical protein